MKKHNIENASPFATKQLGDKLRKELNKQRSKVDWYLELAMAACLGVGLTLAFVIIHQMLTTEWTW